MRCKVAKIEYVKNGISSYCQSNINDIISNLEKAKISVSTLSCPNSFQYKNYINSLHNIISGYTTTANKIEESLNYITREYADLNDRLKTNVDTLDSSLIKERERLII